MKYLKQFCLIMAVTFVAEILRYLIPLPIPASIYGLVLMLIALRTKLIPLDKIEQTGDFLVDVMPFMFVPPAVGLIVSFASFRSVLLQVLVMMIASTVITMGVTGIVAQAIIRRDRRKQA